MRSRFRVTIAVLALAAALSICASWNDYSASAAPTLPRKDAARVAVRTVVASRVGIDRASLETTAPSIPSGRSFGYAAKVVLARPADHVRVRIQVRHPSGRLIFQRTRTFDDAERGSVEAAFERGTDDLDLRPGVYPVELEVAVRRDGVTREGALGTGLLVYDGERPPTQVAVVTRIEGQPLSDPNGRFVAEPGRYVKPRDHMRSIAEWVLTDERVRVTVAVPPLLLEEWRRIADGYEFAGPEGVERIGSDSDVSQQYAATLRILENALATGRLELAYQGYSDPDLSDLADSGLVDDVVPQYERGLSSAYASLEATTSTGTVPANGCVPPKAAAALVKAGVGYAVVSDSNARTKEGTPTPSSYRSTAGLVVLVPDTTLSDAVEAGDASATVMLAFQRHIDEDAVGPLVIAARLGAGGSDPVAVRDATNALLAMAWVKPATASGTATRPGRTVRLLNGPGNDGDPSGYWSDVRSARRLAGALLAALGEGDAGAVTAERDSLIAECSAWAGADGTWALADRGRSFADRARRLASAVIDQVSLAVQPITLAGARGDVPVTIRNDSESNLSVKLTAEPGGGMRVVGKDSRQVELGPGETTVEIPVDLNNALSGTLRVVVTAGGVELESTKVTVRASYLDRVVTIVGVALLLGVLLTIIIRRTRQVERDGVPVRSEAYTESDATRRTGG